MRRVVALLALAASPAWATLACGPNISGTSTPACWSVNPANGQVTVKPRDPSDLTQHVIVTPDGRIRSAVDGKCIGSRSANTTTPAETLTARACTSVLVSGDRWVHKRASGSTTHQINSQLGSLLAGAVSDAPASGTPVTMWTADGSAAQNWRFIDYPIPARSTDTTVKTLTVQSGLLKYDGLTVSTTAELDCSSPLGRYCKVTGTSRYARALLAAPGVAATEIAAITYDTPTGGGGGTGTSAWVGGIPSAAYTGLTASGPITVTANNQTIQGLAISNPSGNCIRIAAGVTGTIIRGNNIGPCGRSTNSDDYGGGGFGVYALPGSAATTIQGNYIADVAGAIRLSSAHPNVVDRNRIVSVRGALNPQGNSYIAAMQFVGVAYSASARSKVTCNVLDATEWGNSVATQTPGIEDGLSMNASSGITARYNKFRGGSHGYTSTTGSAGSAGDDGGSYNQYRDNIAVSTPNHGFFTAGGTYHIVENNTCYNAGAAGSNTSLCFAAAGFQGQTGHDQIFRNNRGWSKYWQDGSGTVQSSSFHTPVTGREGGAVPVTGLVLTDNNFADTTLSDAIWNTSFADCNGTGTVPDGTITFPQIAQTIPLQSTITARSVPYPRFVPAAFQGRVKYEIFNNNWTANSNNGNNTLQAAAGTWSQSVGISPTQDNHSINFRLKWSYPQRYSGQEVLNYPGIVEGRGATTSASTPQGAAKLPALVSSISSYRTGYASAAGPMSGLGHLSYDLWLSDNPAWTGIDGNGVQHRIAEIMLPRRIVGAYGVPNTPSGAAAGRNCQNLGVAGTTCWGRNPNIYKERATIAGQVYDVYHAPPNSQYTGLNWNFVVFQPLSVPGADGDTIEWKPFLDYLNSKTWLTHPVGGATVTVNSTYLNSMEFGVEAINPNTYDLATGGSWGDIQVMGFWTEVNGARY